MQTRWSHAFPVALRGTKEIFGSLWKSLCEPALLPLTTAVRPNEPELKKSHDFNNYSVMFFGDPTHDVERFRDLVNIRISQCFQVRISLSLFCFSTRAYKPTITCMLTPPPPPSHTHSHTLTLSCPPPHSSTYLHSHTYTPFGHRQRPGLHQRTRNGARRVSLEPHRPHRPATRARWCVDGSGTCGGTSGQRRWKRQQ
jgi:hypothetical protein